MLSSFLLVCIYCLLRRVSRVQQSTQYACLEGFVLLYHAQSSTHHSQTGCRDCFNHLPSTAKLTTAQLNDWWRYSRIACFYICDVQNQFLSQQAFLPCLSPTKVKLSITFYEWWVSTVSKLLSKFQAATVWSRIERADRRRGDFFLSATVFLLILY